MFSRLIIIIVAAAVVHPILPVELQAQRGPRTQHPGRVPVIVAVVPGDQAPQIIRNPSHAGELRDVIVIGRSRPRRAEELAAAARALLGIMDREGDRASRAEVISLAGLPNGAPREVELAEGIITRALLGPTTTVPRVGKTWTGTLYLPENSLRGELIRLGAIRVRDRD